MNIFTTIFVLSYVTLVLGETASEVLTASLLPKLEIWWGPKDAEGQTNTDIRPFSIEFNDEMITDLRQRINNRRKVTPPLEGVGFEYGFNTNILDSWMDYWANNYSFCERETYLNQYPQYKTNIQGLDIHFIWVKPEVSSDMEVVPLLMLHGWPGSVREFYKAIPLVTAACEKRGFAVEVIVPSLPGFGFSDGATQPGFGNAEIAVVLRNLMQRLGFKKFYIQAGDFGAIISSNIVTFYPDEVLGYHTNFAMSLAPASLATWFLGSLSSTLQSLVTAPAVADRLYPISSKLKFLTEETGYLHIQASKPDTIGVAMSDSPSGLLAYILQCVAVGTRSAYKSRVDGGLTEIFTREELLDNLMFYWANNAFTTAIRIYSETFNIRTISMGIDGIPTSVPTWTIHAKDELIYQSPAMLKNKYTNLLNSTVLNDYGHFLAFEAPDVLVEDLFKAIVACRQWHATKARCNEEL